MAEGEATPREAILPKPSKVVYAEDTLRGRVNKTIRRAKETYGKYFKGEDPKVKTTTDKEFPEST